MKNILKICLLLVTLSLVTFYACHKDNAVSNYEDIQYENAAKPKLVYLAEYESYQISTDKAKAKIAELTEAMRGNNLVLRSSETVSLDEAVWNIEALANASQARAKWHYKNLKVFTSYIPLTATTENGKKRVSKQEVSDKYGQVVSEIKQAEKNTRYPGSHRKTIYADVSPYQDESGNIVLELRTGVGTDPNGCNGCPVDEEYEPTYSCVSTDCWRTGFRLGTCNTPPSGPGPNTFDASDIIQTLVTSNAAGAPCLSSMNQVVPPNMSDFGYFINILQSPIIRPTQYPNPDFQGTPEIRRYLLFRSFQSAPGGYVTCLNPSDITFFRIGVEKIIISQYNNNVGGLWTGRYFIDCNVFYDFVTDGTQNLHHALRYNVGTYVE